MVDHSWENVKPVVTVAKNHNVLLSTLEQYFRNIWTERMAEMAERKKSSHRRKKFLFNSDAKSNWKTAAKMFKGTPSQWIRGTCNSRCGRNEPTERHFGFASRTWVTNVEKKTSNWKIAKKSCLRREQPLICHVSYNSFPLSQNYFYSLGCVSHWWNRLHRYVESWSRFTSYKSCSVYPRYHHSIYCILAYNF